MTRLPEEFVRMLSSLPGHDKVAEALCNEPSPVAVRLNPEKKSVRPEKTHDTVPWEPLGFYLPERHAFTFYPPLYGGHVYVQDPSAMITGEVIRRLVDGSTRPLKYLDACAAPGGKTTSALSNLPKGSFVLANEFESDRVGALVENVERWGIPNVVVSRSDASRLGVLGPLFDIVCADVPCSGEGMMRKNPTAVSQWSLRLIEECVALQRRIVESVWETVNPGGFLIYSTCTFNTLENERNVEWIRDFLKAEPVDLDITSYPGVIGGVATDVPCARFLPGNVRGEGQFIAVFRKKEDSVSHEQLRIPRPKPVKLPEWLTGTFSGFTDRYQNLYAVSPEYAGLVAYLDSKLRVVMPGLHVGVPKGRDLMPSPGLATSILLSPEIFPEINLGYDDAIRYLQGAALRTEFNLPKGYILVGYEGARLGWVKNVGNRANNLYPIQRRIRSQTIPDTCPSVL